MRSFDYTVPASLEDALGMMGGSSRAIVGGTDLLTLMQAELVAPERLLSVRRLLPAGIEADAGGIRLGAATSLSEIERHEDIGRRFTALSQAAAASASPQLRNMASLGGNLLQRPRCWYFRNPRFPCWLKGGTDCYAHAGENRQHAVFADSPCVAVHPSDLAPALIAFGASLQARGSSGDRDIRLQDFFAAPQEGRRSEHRLREDELILAVKLPAQVEGTRSVYLKAMDRAAFSFALVSVAAVLRLSEGRRVEHARLVLGGVATIPRRAEAAERLLLGATWSGDLIQGAAEASLQGTTPLRQNAWKLRLGRELVKRVLEALAP